MRNKPSPLPSSSLTIIIAAVCRRTGTERCTPVTLAIQPAHKTGSRIKISFISFGKLRIFVVIGNISKAFGKHRDTPIIVCIFQCFGNRFVVLITRHITDLILPVLSLRHQMRQYQRRAFNSSRIVLCHPQTSLIGFIDIKITISFHISVYHHRYRMISDHRTGIVSGQLPHREHTAFTMFLNKRTDKCFIQIRIDNCHQRMIGTESIPQREYGIHRLIHVSLMSF